MGRTAKIPREEALRSAMKLFWSQGYSATTLDDIQKATSLQRGSLYAHFSSKENLFREALELYNKEIVMDRRRLVQEAKSAKAGVELFFSIITDHSFQQRKYPGCLNTNTAAELSVIDQDIALRARRGLQSWEEFWIETLERAKAEGSLNKKNDSKSLARLLIVMTQGLNVVSKVNPDPEYLKSIVKAGLRFFDSH